MEKKMTAKDLLKLCNFAIERGQLNPVETYCEFTWWNNKFKPIVSLDGYYKEKETWFIVGSNECNVWERTRSKMPSPCGFYIVPDSLRIESVVHRPLTLNSLMHHSNTYNGEGTIGFLFSNSPVNYWVGINPFKTRIYRNWANETILCFHAEDRDSGEWVPFDRMKTDDIRVFDDSPNAWKKDWEVESGERKESEEKLWKQ